MNIKKFSNFSLNENVENNETIEDKIEDIKDAHKGTTPSEEAMPFSSDLSEVGDPTEAEKDDMDDQTNLSDYTDFNSYETKDPFKKNESITSSGCKIVIINGCDPDSEIDKKTEEFKSKCGVECKEIHLYQLNIQTPKKQEPKDGMQQVYDAIECADAIILAFQVNKGKLCDSLEIAISRIKNYYKKEELKNKIFGAIVIGNEEKVKNDLILTALNDLHMIVCADCLCFCDKSSDMKKMIDSITTLSNVTAMINTMPEEMEKEEDNFKTFDEFSDEAQEPDDKGLPEEEGDDFVDSLKHMSNFTDEDNDAEEEVAEEEDRIIDNENGTITQIQDGEKVTENKERFDFEIKPFDKFFE